MKIEIEKATKEHLESKGVFSWPIWKKEVSRFDWHYDSTEECYLLEGKVVVDAAVLFLILTRSVHDSCQEIGDAK